MPITQLIHLKGAEMYYVVPKETIAISYWKSQMTTKIESNRWFRSQYPNRIIFDGLKGFMQKMIQKSTSLEIVLAF